MSFEKLLLDESHKHEFGSVRVLMCFKNRSHASRSAITSDANAKPVNVYESVDLQYRGGDGEHYILVENLTYDAILTIYDVNSRSAVVYRGFLGKGFEKEKILKRIRMRLPSFSVVSRSNMTACEITRNSSRSSRADRKRLVMGL